LKIWMNLNSTSSLLVRYILNILSIYNKNMAATQDCENKCK
jgi:hypothetical protein